MKRAGTLSMPRSSRAPLPTLCYSRCTNISIAHSGRRNQLQMSAGGGLGTSNSGRQQEAAGSQGPRDESIRPSLGILNQQDAVVPSSRRVTPGHFRTAEAGGDVWYGDDSPHLASGELSMLAACEQARLMKTVNRHVALARAHGRDRRLRQGRKPCSDPRRNPRAARCFLNLGMEARGGRYRLGHQPVT